MAKRGKKKKSAALTEPLIVRPGANFICFNDGLCCTDLHALGPVSKAEAKEMRAISPESIFFNEDVDDLCLKPAEGGGCHFQQNGLCQVHADKGPRAKPVGCQRFPYGLVATPQGGRVTTEHRCPCRTLGDRPPLDLQDAIPSLKDRNDRLEVDQEVENVVELSAEEDVSFDAYLAIESRLLERLAAGEDVLAVLAASAMPDLAESSWPGFAGEFFDMDDGTRGGTAMAWFGDALLHLTAGHTPPKRERPWAAAFERGMAREGGPTSAAQVYNDWIADEIWMFRWREQDVSFDVGRAEMATRVIVAREVQRRLQEEFELSEVQAAAEAVMIAEIATVSSEWPKAIEAIATDPSPAEALS